MLAEEIGLMATRHIGQSQYTLQHQTWYEYELTKQIPYWLACVWLPHDNNNHTTQIAMLDKKPIIRYSK